jgi:hypothetical protein
VDDQAEPAQRDGNEMSGDLSPHFNRREFTCHCGCGLALPSPVLLAGLEELRAHINQPIRILSGHRCARHNAAVGGAPDSQHVRGWAADIVVPDLRLTDLFRWAVGVPVFFSGGVGLYPDKGFIHVDVRGDRVRWGHRNGQYVPFVEAWEALKARETAFFLYGSAVSIAPVVGMGISAIIIRIFTGRW